MQSSFKIKNSKIVGLTTHTPQIQIKRTTKKCGYPGCHNMFIPRSNRQKYCSQKCSHYANTDKNRERVRKYRKKHGYKTIGTGNLGSHRNEDFKVELGKVTTELKNLGLWKVP